MSSVECLREFVSERLTAAAEEIFGVFKRAVVEYEEEIDRQRRLLDLFLKPQIRLQRTELPQQHVWKEDVFSKEQLCNQEGISSLAEDPEPPQIKEEQEKLCSSQEGERLKLKQGTDTFMLTHTFSEKDLSEPELNSNHHLLSFRSHVTENIDEEGHEFEVAGSSRDAEAELKINSNNIYNPTMFKSRCDINTDETPVNCGTCGRVFECRLELQHHLNIHRNEMSYSCSTCGKRFWQMSDLNSHIKVHTDERPYACSFCERRFKQRAELIKHTRTHTGDRPYSCQTCGKRFRQNSALKIHTRIHTNERPYSCKVCGKRFRQTSVLNIHTRIHTNEKPYSCKVCGKSFRSRDGLLVHTRTHTGEKPYSCQMCGKVFRHVNVLKVHMRTHTGEKPYLCTSCGESFCYMSGLKRHMRAHIEEQQS
ncbi:zinc finger protein 501-like [Notolabrus celidotus]|uniref:zinc finger protein 501-like n=1 Tax=Notolabrus celidotus TaxID=1203425 RepID=UPI00148FBA42|nr:zinc finger protein 501-like [Notolabrus celidotus]